jgi:hypothetical protein
MLKTYGKRKGFLMTNEQQEVFEAVDKINEELYKKYSKKDPKNFNYDSLDKMPIVSVTIAGPYLSIGIGIPSTDKCFLPEFNIYNSENNDRIYYEKSDKYETFYKYIKRKFREIKEELNAIKI